MIRKFTRKTILLAAGDPGGARAVWCCHNAFVDAGFNCIILNHGWLPNAANTQIDLVECPNSNEKIEDWLSQNCISGIVFGTSLTDTLPLTIARAGQKLRLPTLCILDNWMNYRERLEVDNKILFEPDIYAVMDELAAQQAVQAGISNRCVHVTGHPSLAELYSEFQSFQPKADGKKTIVFVSEPASTDQGVSTENVNFRGYTEIQVLKLACRLLYPFKDQFKLILQPHPRENIKVLEINWLSAKQQLDGEISQFKTGREAVFAADYVIGMSSILLYEAWLVGKPVLSLQPGLLKPELKLLFQRDGFAFIDKTDNLSEVFMNWIQSPVLPPRKDIELHSSAKLNIASLLNSLYIL